MRSMKRRLALFLALALLAALSAPAWAEPAEGLGRPMDDFTARTIDGGEFTLSEALETHDLVVVNLWATWCTYCVLEFPYLQEAYEQYSDRVAVIALSTEPTDDDEKLKAFAEEHGLTFPIGSDSGVGLARRYVTSGIPTTVVVDRFGNVAIVEIGAQSSTEAFTQMFEFFLSDSYTETTPLTGFPTLRPGDGGASAEALSAAVNTEGSDIAFRNPEDARFWLMQPVEIDGRRALVSTNAGADSTVAEVLATVEAQEGDALVFEVRTSAEAIFDGMFVSVDGEVKKRFPGTRDWTPWAVPLSAGTHEIALGYEKDDYTRDGEDAAWISGVRLARGEDAAAALAALPARPTGERFVLDLAGDGLRAVAFDDPTDVLTRSFALDQYWIVDGASVEASVTLTPDIDPDVAFLRFDLGSGFVPVSDLLKADGSGYETALSMGDGDWDYTFLYVYADPEVLSSEDVRGALLFKGEEGVDAFVDYLASYGYEVHWSEAVPAGSDAVVSADGTALYRVLFVDQNGDPVPDCVVTFCTDATCTAVYGDGEGIAEFEGEALAYHIQVIQAPEGYAFDAEQEYLAEPGGGEVTIALVKE
ncbi:MAG: redoxin domain-containing protein [Clostridia bacterium]|nr:redoxin domain-containing protein [Clostridia bacterium]